MSSGVAQKVERLKTKGEVVKKLLERTKRLRKDLPTTHSEDKLREIIPPWAEIIAHFGWSTLFLYRKEFLGFLLTLAEYPAYISALVTELEEQIQLLWGDDPLNGEVFWNIDQIFWEINDGTNPDMRKVFPAIKEAIDERLVK